MNLEEGCEGRIIKECKKTSWGDRFVHYLDFAYNFMGVCVYIYMTKYHIVYIKYVHFVVCQL